jgi:hypothetical protein
VPALNALSSLFAQCQGHELDEPMKAPHEQISDSRCHSGPKVGFRDIGNFTCSCCRFRARNGHAGRCE